MADEIGNDMIADESNFVFDLEIAARPEFRKLMLIRCC